MAKTKRLPGAVRPRSLHVALPIDIESARRARTLIESKLRDRLPGPVLSDVELLVSELVTNSLRHSDAPHSLHLDVSMRLSSECLHVEVEDPGTGAAIPVRPKAGSGESGYGLFLVDRIASRWGADLGTTTCVWFEIDL